MRSLSTALVLVASTLLASAARAGDETPSLSHTAPFLGHELTLAVEGAPPLANVRVFESLAAGYRALPFGVLELDSDALVQIAQGDADANGTLTVALTLPADAARAEEERHYQALVADPGAPAGLVLSEAVHLRLLGPRVYAAFAGYVDDPLTFPGGLAIVSAIGPSTVATVDFGAPSPAGQARGDKLPVFSPDFSRGAVMASPFELVLFDPFFGGVLATVPFQEASRTLHVGPDGDSLFVLETGISAAHARVHVLDFASGDSLAVVDLPHTGPGLWVTDPYGMAYVAELDTATGRPWIRRFGLVDQTGHDAFSVGTMRSVSCSDLLWAADQLFVGTQSAYSPVNFYTQAELSRVALATFPPEIDVDTFAYGGGLGSITPAPAAGIVLFSRFASDLPYGYLDKARLGGASPILGTGGPVPTEGVRDLAVADAEAWVLTFSIDNDYGDQLYRVDLPTSIWTLASTLTCFGGEGVAVDVVRDAYVDQVLVAIGHCGPIGFQDPMVIFYDPNTGTETNLTLGYSPDSLRVVPVP